MRSRSAWSRLLLILWWLLCEPTIRRRRLSQPARHGVVARQAPGLRAHSPRHRLQGHLLGHAQYEVWVMLVTHGQGTLPTRSVFRKPSGVG